MASRTNSQRGYWFSSGVSEIERSTSVEWWALSLVGALSSTFSAVQSSYWSLVSIMWPRPDLVQLGQFILRCIFVICGSPALPRMSMANFCNPLALFTSIIFLSVISKKKSAYLALMWEIEFYLQSFSSRFICDIYIYIIYVSIGHCCKR